ncbi:MAG: hypothetical protein WAO51_02005, partial [Bacillota bacterium]
GWGLGGSVAFLAGGQLYAVITGLASGVTEPAGCVWAVALASIALYSLALVMTGIAGMSLVRWLYLSQ